MEQKPGSIQEHGSGGSAPAGKDSPVMVFRGKLDTLCAMILQAQAMGAQEGNRDFVADLQEILDFVRSLFSAEYKGTPLGEFRLLGLSSGEMRERSHNPEKYFGLKHLLMHHSMGVLSLRLNLLRTGVRELELAALRAGCREDILEALNRLSSLFYILIYKYLPKDYCPAGNAGI